MNADTFNATYQLIEIGPGDLWGLFTTHSHSKVRMGPRSTLEICAEQFGLIVESVVYRK